MEFFKTVADALQDGQQIVLTIRKSGQNLVASILSDTKGVKDKAVDNIVPIILNGTPEEFEEGFENALKPVAQAAGLVTNIKEFEESVETAPIMFPMIATVQEFKDAKAILQKAANVPDADKKLIDTVEKEIIQASGEGSMFGGETDLSDGKDVGGDVPAEEPDEEETEEDMSDESDEEE